MKKFARQQEDSGQSEDDDSPRGPQGTSSPPPIKLKLSRKDLLRESFEVSGEGTPDMSRTEDSFDKFEPLIKQKNNQGGIRV